MEIALLVLGGLFLLSKNKSTTTTQTTQPINGFDPDMDITYEIVLMLENNDGQFYNIIYDMLLKKAKRGLKLDIDTLANSSIVKNQSRKMRKDLNEIMDDSNYTNMEHDRMARKIFAKNMIDLVMEEFD